MDKVIKNKKGSGTSDQSLFRLLFFSKPLFTEKEKLNLKTYNSTLLDIYIYIESQRGEN